MGLIAQLLKKRLIRAHFKKKKANKPLDHSGWQWFPKIKENLRVLVNPPTRNQFFLCYDRSTLWSQEAQVLLLKPLDKRLKINLGKRQRHQQLFLLMIKIIFGNYFWSQRHIVRNTFPGSGQGRIACVWGWDLRAGLPGRSCSLILQWCYLPWVRELKIPEGGHHLPENGEQGEMLLVGVHAMSPLRR